MSSSLNKTQIISLETTSAAEIFVDLEMLPKRIAIDIVLLPNDQGRDRIIALNETMLKRGNPDTIRLSSDPKDPCLPHLSLTMGCVQKESIPRVVETITKTANQFKPFALKVKGGEGSPNAKQKTYFGNSDPENKRA